MDTYQQRQMNVYENKPPQLPVIKHFKGNSTTNWECVAITRVYKYIFFVLCRALNVSSSRKIYRIQSVYHQRSIIQNENINCTYIFIVAFINKQIQTHLICEKYDY
jgi:hypothetical protein